jgi:hypothetical protein
MARTRLVTCDALGPDAYHAPGIEGLQPSTGDL